MFQDFWQQTTTCVNRKHGATCTVPCENNDLVIIGGNKGVMTCQTNGLWTTPTGKCKHSNCF